MYCPNCGRKLEDGWNHCPYCVEIDSNSQSTEISGKVYKLTKKDMEHELKNLKQNAGGVLFMYGTSAVAKDLLSVLDQNENVICLENAYRNGILGSSKQGMKFRNYMVYTDKRMLYFEKARMVLSLLPFLHKIISVPYDMIQEVEARKRVGIFSGALDIKTHEKCYSFQVGNLKTAEELKIFIEERCRS